MLVGCAHHPVAAPQHHIDAGVSISLYGLGTPESSYGVVDDRRWVTLAGTELVLEHVDPGASLASLVIEPLSGGDFEISRCAREAFPEPPAAVTPPLTIAPGLPQVEVSIGVPNESYERRIERELIARRTRTLELKERRAEPVPTPHAHIDATVHCTVTASAGKHLIRILYVSTKLAYTVQHELAMTSPDKALLSSHFTFATPSWHESADVVIFEGIPGGVRPPSEIARGTVALDGSVAILSTPAVSHSARLRRIYDGAVATPQIDPADAGWNAPSTHSVWVWLELAHTTLGPGAISVHVALENDARDVELASNVRADDDQTLRLPLWIDAQLTGTRQRFADPGAAEESSDVSERLLLAVANLGDTPREVWVEEHARHSTHRKLVRAWPKQPLAGGEIVREMLVVKPHTIERVGYTLAYKF